MPPDSCDQRCDGRHARSAAVVGAPAHQSDGPRSRAAFARERFGAFSFEGIELRSPTSTFDGRLELAVGGRAAEFLEVGPAHTRGDAIAHVPDAATVFSGDILFTGGTPDLAWSGPVSKWLEAGEHILRLGARTIIPGHKPLPTPGCATSSAT
jgi:cyclase